MDIYISKPCSYMVIKIMLSGMETFKVLGLSPHCCRSYFLEQI